LTDSEARFTINVREGIVELEGKESFVDKHLDKFEEIFKTAVKEAITKGIQQQSLTYRERPTNGRPNDIGQGIQAASEASKLKVVNNIAKHTPRAAPTIPPIPVDLKVGDGKVGLREFYAEKKPANHYEKATAFVYYLTKLNKQQEVKFGEILSCYEEVNEKKPSITDIIKNSIRYKGWLEQGSERLSARLTISGENFVKFDLPARSEKVLQPTLV
jgi:hypothetical protein